MLSGAWDMLSGAWDMLSGAWDMLSGAWDSRVLETRIEMKEINQNRVG